jgi:hypothetical protein
MHAARLRVCTVIQTDMIGPAYPLKLDCPA